MPGTMSKHLVLRTYTFQKLFFHINLFFTKKYGIVSLHQITYPQQKVNFALQKQDYFPTSPNVSAFFFIITLSFCKKLVLVRQELCRLYGSVAHSSTCRYIPIKKLKKNLRACRKGPTFAVSKSRKRHLMRQLKHFKQLKQFNQ